MQPDPFQSTKSRFAHPAHGLHPPKDRLDPLAYTNADAVPDMTGSAAIYRGSLALTGHVRGDIPITKVLDEAMTIVALIGAQGDPLASTQLIHEL